MQISQRRTRRNFEQQRNSSFLFVERSVADVENATWSHEYFTVASVHRDASKYIHSSGNSHFFIDVWDSAGLWSKSTLKLILGTDSHIHPLWFLSITSSYSILRRLYKCCRCLVCSWFCSHCEPTQFINTQTLTSPPAGMQQTPTHIPDFTEGQE